MNEIRIGIQGSQGSTNEKACHYFTKKHRWENFEIKYLISTKAVLVALEKGETDYGTFAWGSSRHGLVEETQEAIKRHSYQKIDEVILQLNHALLSNGPININQKIQILSHPQAISEHKNFLKNHFKDVEFIETRGTAIAAEMLKNKRHSENQLAIAPIECAELYGLRIHKKDLPSNQGYQTTIYLVKNKPLKT